MTSLGPAFVQNIRDALVLFHTEAASFIQSHNSLPSDGSQAANELNTSTRSDSIVSACAIGTQLIEFGGEHVTAFVKLITEPVEVIASWTCVRSMLESCALSAWLLDPTIDGRTRIGRTFALRYEGMEQQLKFGRVAGRPQAELTDAATRIDDVERHALNMGFPPIRDKNGRRIGIAQNLPTAVDMIKVMLDEESAYRLLSGVAHGHTWAITGLSFKASSDPDVNLGGVPARRYEKTVDVKGFAYLAARVLKAFSKPLLNQCRYFGWDERRLTSVLEVVYDKAMATDAIRFWRP